MDGAAILCDGEMITVDQIVAGLNHAAQLYQAVMHQRDCHKCADLIEGKCEGWKMVNKAISDYEGSLR